MRNRGKRYIAVPVFLTAVFSAAVLLFFSVVFSSTHEASAEEAAGGPEFDFSETVGVIEKEMRDFVGEAPDRTPFTDGEASAAGHIKSRFEKYGLPTSEQEFSLTIGDKTFESQNVISVLGAYGNTPSDNDRRRVIIGAHYDNTFGSQDFSGDGGHGAYDNATGVAAMLAAAKNLSDNKDKYKLPFAVHFVAFGAEQAGYYGSTEYVSENTDDSSNILLMINFDAIGGGDKLYLYSDETERVHDRFLRSAYRELTAEQTAPVGLHEPPANKRTFLSGNPVAAYSHYGLLSSNNPFMAKGINSASFLSLDWDSNFQYGYPESAENKNIIGSPDDTLETLAELYPGYAEKIALCADLTVYSLTRENFVSSMISSRETALNYSFWVNPIYHYFILLGLLAASALAVYFVVKRLNAKYPRPIVIKLSADDLKDAGNGVFGAEYENPNPFSDLLSELKDEIEKRKDDKNPFDGY